jgi:hypothetical protein
MAMAHFFATLDSTFASSATAKTDAAAALSPAFKAAARMACTEATLQEWATNAYAEISHRSDRIRAARVTSCSARFSENCM